MKAIIEVLINQKHDHLFSFFSLRLNNGSFSFTRYEQQM
jgi:hypothetical protein